MLTALDVVAHQTVGIRFCSPIWFVKYFPSMKIKITPCRFPTKEWKALGTFHAREERTVQSFAVGDEEMFAKYVKVSVKGRRLILVTTISHYMYYALQLHW